MTFNEFIDKIEHERERCRDEFDTCKSVKDYLQMGKYTVIIRAYDWVLELAKDVVIGETKHNDFSWDNVNIGDTCINGDYIGTVARLIFDSEGYCCGVVVNFSDEFGNKWKDISQDDEYKLYKQIGSWVNE